MNVVFVCVFVCEIVRATSLASKTVKMCGTEKEIALEPHSESSSFIVSFDPTAKRSMCRLRVTAPKTHVVNLQFLEEEQKSLPKNDSLPFEKPSPCTMSIYLPDNTRAPFWKGDVCSRQALPDVDLLTNDFKIIWTPPLNHLGATERRFVLTAVGSGPVCKDPFQHTCMRIGRIPMLCISDHLLCDGYQNCPKSSTSSDEDTKLCKTGRNAWQNFVAELVKRYRPPTEDAKWTSLKINSTDSATKWLEWQLLKKNSTDKPEVLEETHNAAETISAMLNKYGPWGYLMMGLLICGTVLFFCGLWECCCKRPKSDVEPPPPLSQPTTVLIMDCGPGNDTTRQVMPPNYDDLDLPPSYTTLFPNKSNFGEGDNDNGSAANNPDQSLPTAEENSDEVQIRPSTSHEQES
ncbi:uncharacterized protein LOC132703799 [Cylas formicarius]|uniref:uncharacterized protein LOC132703799 n=1 Tax=Cylas formicarius TaxID=197179 RepID=UPI0029586257|nr:uncharacterized protein LOC132703799 [Cylas formicarius]